MGDNVIGFRDVKPNEVLTFGAILISNYGEAPLTLDSVRLLGGGPGVTVGPALVAGPDRRLGGIATWRGEFPPESSDQFGVPLTPLPGTKVAPWGGSKTDTITVLIRVTMANPRNVRFTGTEFRYHYRGREYVYVDPLGLQLCPQECPDPFPS